MAGLMGATGQMGATGAQGAVGPTGAQGSGGPASSVSSWTPFKDFYFDGNRTDIQAADAAKANEIANYLRQNPGQQVGIDGEYTPNDTALGDRRVSAVRSALINAGIPPSRIETGAFGGAQMPRNRRVAVLVGRN
jgi:outer membrane protein OmpA-like peptidoglycan-associated protein